MGFVDDTGLELGKSWREREADTDSYTSKSARQSGNKSTGCNLPLPARFIMQDSLETFPEIAVCANPAAGVPPWP